jgi:RNA polymerase sigma-70 factor (ECF subfamily)
MRKVTARRVPVGVRMISRGYARTSAETAAPAGGPPAERATSDEPAAPHRTRLLPGALCYKRRMKPGSREASVAATGPVNEPASAASNGPEDSTGGLVDDLLASLPDADAPLPDDGGPLPDPLPGGERGTGGAPLRGARALALSPDREADRELDRQLVERAQKGDGAAFRQLFDRYQRRAYAVALGVVKNKQDALDVVQEAFIKVHRHLGSFQGTSSFYTWLYRILMNLAIDHVRKHKNREVDFDDRVGRAAADVDGDGAMLPRILDGNPGRNAARKELSAKLHAALAELPEYHRAVIVLREVDGLSYEEMSKILKVPKGTIMSRLFHARRKMQAALEPYVDGDPGIGDDG